MSNELYPIFLKLNQLQLLIVGGGYVAMEKLTFLLKSSPGAQVRVVGQEFLPEVMAIIKKHGIQSSQKAYERTDLDGYNIVIGATNNEKVNRQIYRDAQEMNILVNIADNPSLCDFYLGGIVTKGDLKVAISTNGKSPTMAKRLRQYFELSIPDNIHELLNNLNGLRSKLKCDLESKVNHLNKLTNSILENQTTLHD